MCKTPNALELFDNLHCDDVPDTAPDCSLTTSGRTGSDFFQHCPPNSNCLTITKQGKNTVAAVQAVALMPLKPGQLPCHMVSMRLILHLNLTSHGRMLKSLMMILLLVAP